MILSKFQFCSYFKILTPSQTVSSYKLRRYYFTDKVLEKIGLSFSEYQKLKTFDVETSAKIIAHFNIKTESL